MWIVVHHPWIVMHQSLDGLCLIVALCAVIVALSVVYISALAVRSSPSYLLCTAALVSLVDAPPASLASAFSQTLRLEQAYTTA